MKELDNLIKKVHKKVDNCKTCGGNGEILTECGEPNACLDCSDWRRTRDCLIVIEAKLWAKENAKFIKGKNNETI